MVPVENYIKSNDSSIWWYYIPGFKEYEISNTENSIIRSMKYINKYKYGIIIKPKEIFNIDDLFHNYYDELTYELYSYSLNQRIVIKRSTIEYLAKSNPYYIQGYPRRTNPNIFANKTQRIDIQNMINFHGSITDQSHLLYNDIMQNIDIKLQNGQLINIERQLDHILKPLIFDKGAENKCLKE